MAYEALSHGSEAVIALNAINEIIVDEFLNEKVDFSDISHLIQSALNVFDASAPCSIEDVLEIDASARQCVQEILIRYERTGHGRAT